MVVSSSVSIAALPKLSTVEILGKNYYVYEVKKGDSLFGISRAYGWDYEKLRELNPQALSPLEKGMKIYYPSVETEAEEQEKTTDSQSISKPLTHRVKRGETVYAISRMYGVSVDTIFGLNPGSKDGIKEGETLLLEEVGVSEDDTAPEFYMIKKGDTLYSVARAHYTTVAAIMKKNPGITEKNFKAGDTIRLPQKGDGVKRTVKTMTEEHLSSFSTYKVDKKDTWESIANKTGVDKEDILEVNIGAGDKPKKKSLVAIPNIETTTVEKTVIEEDPRELTEEGIADIYDDVHGIAELRNDKEFKVGLLLSEPASRKDLEFTRGFLTGLNRLKDCGTKINMSVINGNRESTDVLTELSDFNPDILFLTTEKGIPSYLSEFAEVSQTPVVNTFDVKNELYARNPYIIQLLTPSNYFNEAIAARVKSDYGDCTLIFAGETDDNDQLASAIKELWMQSKIKNMTITDIANYTFSGDRKYLIYGYATKKDDVGDLLNAVKESKNASPLADIAVLGRPSWIVYDDDVMEEKFHDTNVLIPSRFYYDKNSAQARRFENHYKSLFDRAPAKSFPMYAVMGYDTSLYFIPGLLRADWDINALGRSDAGAQSEFELQRPGNWTGMLNPLVYLIKFTSYNTIEKLLVR